jgi:hypothetical protein
MLDKGTAIEFLRTGVVRYPDARETVDYFETVMMDEIFAAFNARNPWKHFRPLSKDGDLELGKGVGPGADRYVQAYIAGALPSRELEKVWLSLGVYWNPPRLPNSRAVAACTCWIAGGGGAVAFREVPTRDQRVLIAPIYKRDPHRRLLLELREQSFNPALDFALLLDSADEGLGRTDSDEPPVGLS